MTPFHFSQLIYFSRDIYQILYRPIFCRDYTTTKNTTIFTTS